MAEEEIASLLGMIAIPIEIIIVFSFLCIALIIAFVYLYSELERYKDLYAGKRKGNQYLRITREKLGHFGRLYDDPKPFKAIVIKCDDGLSILNK